MLIWDATQQQQSWAKSRRAAAALFSDALLSRLFFSTPVRFFSCVGARDDLLSVCIYILRRASSRKMLIARGPFLSLLSPAAARGLIRQPRVRRTLAARSVKPRIEVEKKTRGVR